jgi:hypothetical protein
VREGDSASPPVSQRRREMRESPVRPIFISSKGRWGKREGKGTLGAGGGGGGHSDR